MEFINLLAPRYLWIVLIFFIIFVDLFLARGHPTTQTKEGEESLRPPSRGTQSNGLHQLPPKTDEQLQQTSGLSSWWGKGFKIYV